MYIQKSVQKLGADNIRILAAEAVQKANSGHPGMPMGCADFAFTLWYEYLKFNPLNPEWIGRDRFVLSAGHGSMLLYSLLHLFGCGLTIEDLKNFRQWGSLTPGHPEYGHTKGVEVTTGPLGSGFASAVGMAIESKNFTARTNLDSTPLFKDRKIYVICSDGCMMEGCSHEAASLAGHLKLDNIICFYDSNSITIEGQTSLAFSDKTRRRFRAYGWRVIKIGNANDIYQVRTALAEAVKSDGRPTLVIGRTQIAFGSPNKVGKNSAHGEPLGGDEVMALKKNLGFPEDPFFVKPEVAEACKKRTEILIAQASEWDRQFNSFLEANPKSAKLISDLLHKPLPANLLEELVKAAPKDKPNATRASGGVVLQKASELVPALAGGAADLAPSTKTDVKNEKSFSPEDRTGRNIHFGVREFGMALATNGMALWGSSIPYCSTFLIFSDFMKPAIRLAAIQNLHVIYVFTHDSIYVGEDGPTHQPVDQLAMLRAIPGMTVIRPAEAYETAHSWNYALRCQGPVALVLTRQNLEPLPGQLASGVAVERGAYVLSDDGAVPDYILIATGSEVNLALKATVLLRSENFKVRVVSMPSVEIFRKQDISYRESVIPSSHSKKVTIELGSTFGWHEFAGDKGLCIGIDRFGASAPQKILEEKFGFTPKQIVERIKDHFQKQ